MANSNLTLKTKILYVDDESINLRLFNMSFKSDFEIYTAKSGEEALQLIHETPIFDIIVSDQRMPGISGTEFMIEAKKTLPNSKYILLTGYTDIEALEHAVNKVGLWQYVKKPWEPSNLKFILDNAQSSLIIQNENIRISHALKQSEERLHLALNGTNAGVWDWNLITNEIYLSPHWKLILGYQPEELENKLQTVEHLLHPEDVQKSLSYFDEFINGKSSVYELEYRLKHKNGNYIHVLSRGKAVLDHSKKLNRLIGTIIDLTEKNKTQEEIKGYNQELEERVERRTHALKILNDQLIQRNKFEHLISKISSELIGIQTNQLDSQLNAALGDIIEFNGADHAFILKFHNSEITVEHENHQPNIYSDIKKIFHRKKFVHQPLIIEKLTKGEAFIVSDVKNIPSEYTSITSLLKDANIHSVIMIPLLYKENLRGALGLSCKSTGREWNHEDLNLLRLVSEIFINSFERNDNEKILRKRDQEISNANKIISENEKKTKLLQSIASIANSSVKIEEALIQSNKIITGQGLGISSILFKVLPTKTGVNYAIENIQTSTEQNQHEIKDIHLNNENTFNLLLDQTFQSSSPSTEKNIKLNHTMGDKLSHTFDIASIPIIAEDQTSYVYLILLPPENILFSDSNLLEGISREISFLSERDKTKKELKNALEKEKKLGELQSQFISMASHQFRTPLTVIQSNIELFQMVMDNTDKVLKEKFDTVCVRIKDQVFKLVDLMNDVLLIGKLNAKVLKAIIKPINIIDSIKNVMDQVNSIQKDNRNSILTIHGKSQLVKIDQKLFTHAFTNLLDNAFKYSKDRTAPQIDIYFEKKAVTLDVTDFGRGIPKDEINNLFQPFYRSDNVQDIEGTGLGLVICKRYIELNGGSISVKSSPNERTTFTIIFPQLYE
ncbi:MAG: hypothetical protein CMP61_05730 [Flavobacteriales bacterium]|nr:hypothetical protein [Flavobacteriales bacterium]|tara:strand:- start:13944 stop:16637 length:2694 start_codon:yes stop_codon:yes gene_type:complete